MKLFSFQTAHLIYFFRLCDGDLNHTDKQNGNKEKGEDTEIYRGALNCRKECKEDEEKGVTFVMDMIAVGGRQTWPDVTLTMILSDM